ncbi:hypothetical protein ACHHYP_14139 [Achlya hypogyna]|uniref:Uncharacterized protein n=1 Tax=Achlya hypogyna TaxID=1202772 RepID=A0A1V9YDW0_ACHHY|nr:hypothetical protein ACHHYP_14139 [Achlya hypogyna]
MHRRAHDLDELWLEADTEAFALNLALHPAPSTRSIGPSLSEINQLDFYAIPDADGTQADECSSQSSTSTVGPLEVKSHRPEMPTDKTSKAYSQIDVTRVRAEMQLIVKQLQLENAQLKKRLKASEAVAAKQKQQLQTKHNLKLAAKDRQLASLQAQLDAQAGAHTSLHSTISDLEIQVTDLQFEMKMMDKAYANERAAWVEKERMLRLLQS